MKRTFQFLALVAISSAMMVSCKNNKTTEPTPEEIQAQKVALADSVLAQIDAFANNFIDASTRSFDFVSFELTEEEKLVKPDYLLEPEDANKFVTKSQKVNALAIYIVDLPIRKMYDMPMDETKGVIAKLAAELNHPLTPDDVFDFDVSMSEKVKKEYEVCKERGELAYFWQFHNAILIEIAYVIGQNPELFFSKITEEQWQAFMKRTNEENYAMRELAKYDEEMADVLEIFNKNRVVSSDEEKAKVSASIESEKQFRLANNDKFIAYRNVLLQ